ncbi:MAG: transposon-transfer assisting family protein [Eubacteriales bacterium]|mgnify:CR=1 FL=1|jgi:hypothetical protein
MMNFTNDEINLMCIYNTGTRDGLIKALTDMRKYLEDDEAELYTATDTVIEKLKAMSDDEFSALDLVPDFS